MKLLVSRWAAGTLAILALLIPARAQESASKLAVPARELPIPNTVSPELQKVLARPVPPQTDTPTTAEGWKKLQQERDAVGEATAKARAERLGVKVEAVEVGGVKCYRLLPKEVARGKEKKLLVHVHGGAHVFNGGLAATGEAVLLADACMMPVLSVDYRMPPDHPFPAGPDDVLAVWKAVLKDHDAAGVVMGGTSAGGNLVMTTMLRCKAEGLPMPAALFIGTPGADLSKTGDTVFTNAEIDHVLGRYEGRIEACIRLYAGGHDLKEPLLSPIYGDMSGWPPTILITGTRDLLLSSTVRTHRKLRAAGVPAELHVYEGQSHADYLFAFPAPESRDALAEISLFFDRHLKR
jgi:epsilon-lactone hydrolase